MAQAKTTRAKSAPTTKAAAKPAVEATKEVTPEAPLTAPAPKWEYKDRLYELTSSKKPLVFTLPTVHSVATPLLWFDEELGTNRELRYATNQNSPFVDEQDGNATLGRIVFRDGILRVPRENVVLQKLLSLYHPYTKGGVIKEYMPDRIAENQVDWIEFELEAMTIAKDLDIDAGEAILRAQYGSEVTKMSSKEIKRDLLIFARNEPRLFLDLANDENVMLRNIGIRATEMGLLNLSEDQRTFTYGNTGRKLMTVPFNEHPYSALAAYFKTDEGMEVLRAVEKQL